MPPKITVPPGANVAEPGVFKSMYGMVRLVDLRVRFGVDESDYTKPGKIIIVEVEGGHAGFWVDEIEDVTGFPETGWAQVPAYIPGAVFSRTWIKDREIRLYADFEKLDKFKSTGYLRKHIETLKSVEAKVVADNISNRTKEKNIRSEKIDKNFAVDEKRSKGIQSKTGKSKSEKVKKSDIKNHVEPIRLESESIKKVEFDKQNLVSDKNKLDVGEGNYKNNLYFEKNKHVSHVVGGEVKVSDFRSSAGSGSGFANKTVVSNKKNTQVKPTEKTTLIESQPNDSLVNKPQSFIDKKNKDETKSGLILKLIFGLVFIGFIYFVYDFIYIDIENKERNKRAKIVESVKDEYKLNYELNDAFSKHEIKSPIGLAIESPNENNNEIDKPIDKSKIHTKNKVPESTVKISNVEDGVLIVIDEYEDDEKLTVLNVDAVTENKIEPDVLKLSQGKSINENKHDEILDFDNDESTGDVVGKAQKEDVKEPLEELSNNLTVDLKVEVEKYTGESESVVNDVAKKPIENNAVKLDKKTIKKITKPASRKYVHVVVKGDTLWHIAKRYVNNPWRYPELARLSRIKNPDLIYPGNKVTIIVNYKK